MNRPISIVRLSTSAQFPFERVIVDAGGQDSEHGTYAPFTLLPKTPAEHEALRCWVTTHQTMFLVTGAAAGTLAEALKFIETANFSTATEFLSLTTVLRKATAVYTYLPTLDRATYESFLRPAMTGVRPSFSGVSSREAIEFAILIKRLREIQIESVPELEAARTECLEADRIWWQCHVGAMQRMVGNPISLAQQEFKRQKGEGLESSYSEFLVTTLQVTEALDDYDRFFACYRGAIDAEGYLKALSDSLLISDEYISNEEPFAAYRAGLSPAIQELGQLSVAVC